MSNFTLLKAYHLLESLYYPFYKHIFLGCLLFYLEVDACLDRDVCDQQCVDMNGNLTCQCHKDYQMNHTTGRCQAKGKKKLHATDAVKVPDSAFRSCSVSCLNFFWHVCPTNKL